MTIKKPTPTSYWREVRALTQSFINTNKDIYDRFASEIKEVSEHAMQQGQSSELIAYIIENEVNVPLSAERQRIDAQSKGLQ